MDSQPRGSVTRPRFFRTCGTGSSGIRTTEEGREPVPDSGTRAMSDTFQAYQGRVTEIQEKLQYVAGATGVAVAIGKKIVAVISSTSPLPAGKSGVGCSRASALPGLRYTLASGPIPACP